MKNRYLILSLWFVLAFAACSGNKTQTDNKVEGREETAAVNDREVEWLTWEAAVEKGKGGEPKKMFIDMYTSWCGWCKKMDASTFKDKDVVKYLNEHFYAVKFDAEQKEDVTYNGHTFKYVKGGRRGYHQLAASLLDNRMSYPSFVAMDENMNRITIIPGYRDAAGLMPILRYLAEEKYKTMTFQQYEQTLGGG